MSFKPGDIVDITIEGARARAIRGEDIVDHLSYETEGFVASVALTESVTVERVAPAEWPPRPGDAHRPERTGDLHPDSSRSVRHQIALDNIYGPDHESEPAR